jgi:tRNA A37 threonylcarbamoyladenosine dehydratase
VPVIACGAAGGRRDPLQLRAEDLARTRGDSLLASLRSRLRRQYGFPAAVGASGHDLARAPRFGVPAIFSPEPAAGGAPVIEAGGMGAPGAPLACAGYGSIVTVTASMGMAAAGLAIEAILRPAQVRTGAGRPPPAPPLSSLQTATADDKP